MLRHRRSRTAAAGDDQVKTFWMILAAAGGVMAVVFVFGGVYEKAFVAAAAGAICWFLNFRVQLKRRLDSRNAENEESEEPDEEVRP